MRRGGLMPLCAGVLAPCGAGFLIPGAPGRVTSLCFAKEKSPRERRPDLGALRVPCAAHKTGAAPGLACGSNILAETSPLLLRCSALSHGMALQKPGQKPKPLPGQKQQPNQTKPKPNQTKPNPNQTKPNQTLGRYCDHPPHTPSAHSALQGLAERNVQSWHTHRGTELHSG